MHMGMCSSDSPINHAKHQQQQWETRLSIVVVELDQVGLSTMSDDHERRMEDNTPKDHGPSEKDLPHPWAAAIACPIVAAVEKYRRPKNGSPRVPRQGLWVNTFAHTHTIAGKSGQVERSVICDLVI